MALADSIGFSVSMLVGLRRASAVEELSGETMKLGLSMIVICLSKGTTCMLLVSPMETPTLHIHSCFKLLMMLLFPTFGKPITPT
jgi:hypothetical protein